MMKPHMTIDLGWCNVNSSSGITHPSSPRCAPGSQEFGAAAAAQTGHEAQEEHDIAMEHLNASVSGRPSLNDISP